ncbi:hypothetical protein N566_08215 [Streptomycetaceae bacterium MP113-05]|nr:hypothetical protein N566_08215 [Streptomycetaceae bacterium MP113-05]
MTAFRRLTTGCTVHACFSLSDIPRVSVATTTGDISSVRAVAVRTLAESGRGHLGGRVELRTHGHTLRRRAVLRAADRAVALAVTATLRGDTTGVRVPVRPHA